MFGVSTNRYWRRWKTRTLGFTTRQFALPVTGKWKPRGRTSPRSPLQIPTSLCASPPSRPWAPPARGALTGRWPPAAALATSDTNKPLRLAAIEALGAICPLDSVAILANLTDSQDEDIAETAGEGMSMLEEMLADGLDDEEIATAFADDEADDEESGSGNHESIH